MINDYLDEALVSDQSAMLTIERGGREKEIEIIPVAVVNFLVSVGARDSVNAKATGKRVVINRGMLRFAENDHELAFVISHEIAHNLMRHVRAVMANYTLGSIVDIAALSVGIITGNAVGVGAAYIHASQFEAEADYVGLYIMALANLPIDEAAHFWRRIAAVDPGSIKKKLFATPPRARNDSSRWKTPSRK
jgi:Zn-dependent protease with chaperone function